MGRKCRKKRWRRKARRKRRKVRRKNRINATVEQYRVPSTYFLIPTCP